MPRILLATISAALLYSCKRRSPIYPLLVTILYFLSLLFFTYLLFTLLIILNLLENIRKILENTRKLPRIAKTRRVRSLGRKF